MSTLNQPTRIHNFTLFRELPAELSDMIWVRAPEGRVVGASWDTAFEEFSCTSYGSTSQDPLLYTNRNSREAYINDRIELCFSPNRMGLLQPKFDILHFDDVSLDCLMTGTASPRDLFATGANKSLAAIRNVAIDYFTCFPRTLRDTEGQIVNCRWYSSPQRAPTFVSSANPFAFLDAFRNLERVLIVLPDPWMPAPYHTNVNYSSWLRGSFELATWIRHSLSQFVEQNPNLPRRTVQIETWYKKEGRTGVDGNFWHRVDRRVPDMEVMP